MFKNKTYNGEIWLENDSKHFCVLERINDGKIILKSSLGVQDHHKLTINVIYGRFNGLGHLTLIGNYRKKYSSGVTYDYEYLVKYCFRSNDYYINLSDLKIRSASFYNDTIAKLYRKVGYVDLNSNTYKKNVELNLISNIEDDYLKEVITESYKESNSDNLTITLTIKSLIKFIFKAETSLDVVISKYNVFKDFILLFFGYFEQFSNIVLTLENNSKIDLYYSDRYTQEKPSSIFNFTFSQIEKDYLKLLEHWFEDEHLRFICSSIIDNIIYRSINPHKRFLNSFYSLEGWLKFKYKEDKAIKKGKFKFDIEADNLRDDFLRVSGIESEELQTFYKKCVRHRDYFVHTNTKQTKMFSEVEAVEISNLFDYVLMLQILKHLKASEELQELANSKFSGNFKSFSYEFRKYMIRDGK